MKKTQDALKAQINIHNSCKSIKEAASTLGLDSSLDTDDNITTVKLNQFYLSPVSKTEKNQIEFTPTIDYKPIASSSEFHIIRSKKVVRDNNNR